LNKIKGFVLDDKEISKNVGVHSPMVGLYSAFKELLDLGYQKALTISCDMPLIKKNVIELLINESIHYDCVIPKWKNGFLEPLFAVYPIKEALFRIEYFLNRGAFKLINIIDKNWKIKYIIIEEQIQPLDNDLVSFININNLTDLEELTKKYNKNKKN